MNTPPPTSPRLAKNNFDLLRVLFALTVCLVHAHTLSGYREIEWIPTLLSSEIAVQAFFVVSGFLIFMSYERSQSLASYAGKRARRIYPAYFTIVMICALGLWTVSSQGIGEYFSKEWLEYVGFNLVFLNFVQQSLPGVFENHRFDAVNGVHKNRDRFIFTTWRSLRHCAHRSPAGFIMGTSPSGSRHPRNGGLLSIT